MELLFRLRYWALRKLDGVDGDHYRTLVDGYLHMVEQLNRECGEARREADSLRKAISKEREDYKLNLLRVVHGMYVDKKPVVLSCGQADCPIQGCVAEILERSKHSEDDFGSAATAPTQEQGEE